MHSSVGPHDWFRGLHLQLCFTPFVRWLVADKSSSTDRARQGCGTNKKNAGHRCQLPTKQIKLFSVDYSRTSSYWSCISSFFPFTFWFLVAVTPAVRNTPYRSSKFVHCSGNFTIWETQSPLTSLSLRPASYVYGTIIDFVDDEENIAQGFKLVERSA